MTITGLLETELAHEAIGIRKVLEHVPEGKNGWKPHARSMPLGYLATLVANIPVSRQSHDGAIPLRCNPRGHS